MSGTFRVHLRTLQRPSPVRGAHLRSLCLRLARAMGPGGCDVRILLVGERSMRRWNRAAFSRDRATDVISFPEAEPDGDGSTPPAGDVLVCPPVCLAATEGWEATPEERVLYYLVHAFLHLAGHEHVGDPAGARRMRRRERALYRAVTGKEPG